MEAILSYIILVLLIVFIIAMGARDIPKDRQKSKRPTILDK